MFGNKNSAVPYVRIGGVDRQSVLTSNANGNTPVKEIGVNANGNLIFSTDLATFKSVLDLKYSQFKSNDENQEDTWETEKSVSMKATDGTSTTQLTVTPTGAKLTGALKIAKGSNSGIQDYLGLNLLYIDNNDVLHIRNDQGNEIHLGSASGEEIQIGGHKLFSHINVIGQSFTYNDKPVAVTSDIPKTLNNKTLVANGNTTIYGTDITLASDNTSNVTDAINNANTRIDNLTTTVNGKADISAIPTALYQLIEDATHRVVTDTEKATWNAKSNFDGAFSSLSGVPTASEGTAGIIQIATDQEAENGTNTSKAVNPKQLKTAIDGLGTVFDLKGTKATIQDLPTTGNEIGDVWYVTAEQVGYIWLNDGATDKWEQFGSPIDLSGYVQYIDIINNLTSTATNKALSAYQGKVLKDLYDTLNQKSLKLPNSSPSETALVGINNNGEQVLVDVDAIVSSNSENPVKSNAVASALGNYLRLTGGTLTGNVTLTVGNNIVDSNGKELIAPKSSGVIFGDITNILSLKGSQVRPSYTSNTGSGTESLALYSDIPTNYVTTNTEQTISSKKTFTGTIAITGWTISQDSSGNLVFTKG